MVKKLEKGKMKQVKVTLRINDDSLDEVINGISIG
jgi:hypothetical protein